MRIEYGRQKWNKSKRKHSTVVVKLQLTDVSSTMTHRLIHVCLQNTSVTKITYAIFSLFFDPFFTFRFNSSSVSLIFNIKV